MTILWFIFGGFCGFIGAAALFVSTNKPTIWERGTRKIWRVRILRIVDRLTRDRAPIDPLAESIAADLAVLAREMEQ